MFPSLPSLQKIALSVSLHGCALFYLLPDGKVVSLLPPFEVVAK